jgi:hypothetical protein
MREQPSAWRHEKEEQMHDAGRSAETIVLGWS